MSCEEAIQQLPDFALGTLSEVEAAAVRRHLRGCAACRQEAAKLDEGMVMFASAAHAVSPPPELKARVMSVLGDEWNEAPAQRRPRHVARWLAAAAVVLLAGALTWAGVLQSRQGAIREDARSYASFLHALGGRDVRTAILHPAGGSGLEGSAVLYDSDKGQSWALVEVRGLGYPQPLTVTLSAPGGRSIQLPFPIKISPDGQGAAWLVTSANISSFRTVTVTAPGGATVATGNASA